MKHAAGLVVWLLVATVSLGAALQPPPESSAVTSLAVKLFEHAHYSHHKLDAESVSRFLIRYVEALDYNRLFFLQIDLKEFDNYLPTLPDRTRAGDVQPGFDIFARYQQRIEQAVAIAKECLKQPMTFDGNETILIDRSKAPWPANEAERAKLWRERVKYDLLQESLNKTKPDEAIRVLTRRYDRLLRSVREMDAGDVLEVYLNSLCHAYDPHSDYLGASQLKDFEIGMRLSLFGIGAVLRSEDGYAKIVSLVPGGPADLDKRLKPDDRIVAVGEGDQPPVDVVDMKLTKVVEHIRGAKGTKVKLTVMPANAADSSVRKVITIVRDEVKLTEQQAKAKVFELPAANGAPAKRLGVIELPSFYADTEKMRNGDNNFTSSTRHVAILIEKLKAQKVDGIVLDLRRNGGGLLDEAIALAGLFIKEGPIVQIKDPRNRIQVLRDEDPSVTYDGPLLVLVSHISASASEILAAAMQDYGRALVVGDSKTFGKGTVQTMLSLSAWLQDVPNPGALKLTTQKFYRVAGGSTQNRGVIPDIIMPSSYDVREIGESSLNNAMPYDEVQPAPHQNYGSLNGKLTELRQRSMIRAATDPEFTYLNEDIARVKQQLKVGTVSLNQAKRLEEKKATTDRDAARKKERHARAASALKFTEITVGATTNAVASASMPRAAATAAATKPTASSKPADHDTTPDADGDDENGVKEPPTDPLLNESLSILRDLVVLAPPPSGTAVAATPSPR
ncbi:MAG: carboxy terminal-processing peptidase [Verrucomicrobia bacterium]|nr:carboxy terminal-processing peptidase [Verrucomicrobiota bacterium]